MVKNDSLDINNFRCSPLAPKILNSKSFILVARCVSSQVAAAHALQQINLFVPSELQVNLAHSWLPRKDSNPHRQNQNL